MKSIVCSLSLLFVIAMLPFTGVAQYQDDLYRRTSSSKKTEKTVKSQTEDVEQLAGVPTYAATDAYVPDSVWDVDAYNRRYTSTIETPYEEEGEVEDTAYEDEEVGFYLIGYYGTKSDLEYAERIRKFHDPDFIIHLTDSAYNTVYYVDSFNGDIYINGSYVYGYPDSWYWNYYSPYYWGWGAWGWSSPYWGWGAYFSWSSPYWGWNWGWSYPYYVRHPHYGGYGGGWHNMPHYAGGRPTNGQNRSNYSPGGYTSHRPTQSGGTATRSSNVGNRQTTATKNYNTRGTNTSRSSQGQTTTRQTHTPNTPSTRSNNNIGSSQNNMGSSRNSMGPSQNNTGSSRSNMGPSQSNMGSSRGSMGGTSRGSTGGGGGSHSRR